MTIDVAKLRSLARYQNDAVITAEEITALLDAYEECDRLRAALRQVTRRRTAWLSIGAINNVAEIRVERELFEEWVRLIPALEGRE